MFRPLTACMGPTLALALSLSLALAAPTQAQRGGSDPLSRSGSSGDDARGSGGKSGKIFGGARVRLAPQKKRGALDVSDVMRKVKELQVKSKARGKGDTERVVEMADEAQLRAWFETCDHNANGWVSFSESAHSLKFSRGRFLLFDDDRDGRMVSDEFEDYYIHSIMSSGSFTRPRARSSGGPPPPRTPLQLRAAYDTDLDGALAGLELSQLLLDYEQAAADPDALLSALDVDKSGNLTLEELPGLHEVLYPEEPDQVLLTSEDAGPRSILDLFGEVVPRPSETDAPPSPPQLVGPVPQFHRLDIDGDGFISIADLETLMRPIRVGVRPHAVINTLDTDGDMRLSAAELRKALGAVDR